MGAPPPVDVDISRTVLTESCTSSANARHSSRPLPFQHTPTIIVANGGVHYAFVDCWGLLFSIRLDKIRKNYSQQRAR